MYQNLKKARWQWGMVATVLTKEGVPVRALVILYKVVVNMVLLYGNEIWVTTGGMLTVLEGFHHWLVRQISGDKAQCDQSRV